MPTDKDSFKNSVEFYKKQKSAGVTKCLCGEDIDVVIYQFEHGLSHYVGCRF
jgi:hypothetical protein